MQSGFGVVGLAWFPKDNGGGGGVERCGKLQGIDGRLDECLEVP